MKNMNLNSLRVFACVARHSNLQRAADELNLTRGAVSQRIKQLETDLGVVLLERQARGVTLTAEGVRCHQAVGQALATLETMPLVFSRAARDPKVAPGPALASVATLGYGGMLLGPPIIGFVAQITGMRMSWIVLAVLAVLAIVLAPRLRAPYHR